MPEQKPVQGPRQLTLKECLFVVLLIVGIPGYYILKSDSPKQEPLQATPQQIADDLSPSAFVVSKNFVSAALKSPSTAKFPLLEYKKTDMGNHHYLIASYVDAQNSFGGTLRSNWLTEVQYSGTGKTSDPANWTLKSLIIDDQVIYPTQ